MIRQACFRRRYLEGSSCFNRVRRVLLLGYYHEKLGWLEELVRALLPLSQLR
jgi:hypothetical protein